MTTGRLGQQAAPPNAAYAGQVVHFPDPVRAARHPRGVRVDGDGYPDKIAGEEIPLESRIVFVCDAYHAMTTDRPYRKRLSHREAMRRLAEGAGSQFDPHVVEVALRVLEQPPADS